MSVYVSSLDALVRPRDEAQVHGQEPLPKALLCAAMTRICQLARFVLRFLGQVLVLAGLVLIATVSADGAHDLFVDPGAARGEEPRPTANGRIRF